MTYNEYMMYQNLDLVAGTHGFEDIDTHPIILCGIAVDGAAPRVRAVISYMLLYAFNGSPFVLKIAPAEGFSRCTIFYIPFQRKAKLTYMPHSKQIVIS
jgi:hypothetical protein